MKKQSILAVLACLSAKNVESGDEWVSCSCPLAPWTHSNGRDANPSFGVKITESGDSYYNCWACGGGPSLEHLIGRLRSLGASGPKYNLNKAIEVLLKDVEEIQAVDIKDYSEVEKEVKSVHIFDQDWIESNFKPVLGFDEGVEYLNSRDVDEDAIQFFDIRWDAKRKTVCFPIYGKNKECLGLHGRYINPPTYSGKTVRYHSYSNQDGNRNPSVWFGEWYLDSDLPVVMVEGVFDVLAVWAVWPNVVSPLFASMNRDKLQRLKYRVNFVITMFDEDKAGDMAREKIEKSYKDKLLSHIVLDPKIGKDPGEYPKELLGKLIDAELEGLAKTTS